MAGWHHRLDVSLSELWALVMDKEFDPFIRPLSKGAFQRDSTLFLSSALFTGERTARNDCDLAASLAGAQLGPGLVFIKRSASIHPLEECGKT